MLQTSATNTRISVFDVSPLTQSIHNYTLLAQAISAIVLILLRMVGVCCCFRCDACAQFMLLPCFVSLTHKRTMHTHTHTLTNAPIQSTAFPNNDSPIHTHTYTHSLTHTLFGLDSSSNVNLLLLLCHQLHRCVSLCVCLCVFVLCLCFLRLPRFDSITISRHNAKCMIFFFIHLENYIIKLFSRIKLND